MRNIVWHLRQFAGLVKFGIVFGNLFPLIAGFFLAGGQNYQTLFFTILFGGGVIACGCVINNYIDIDIDKVMERTKNRPLPLGNINPNFALIFGFCLGVISLSALWLFVGFYSFLFASIGLFFYVVIYTILTKRRTIFSVHIGSISGAIPPLIGYCAVQNPNFEAFLLFFVVAIWQMPHSFAIHTFRQQDYQSVQIKTFPSVFGLKKTARSMLFYIIIYTIFSAFLFWYSNLGAVFLILEVIFCFLWLKITLDFYKKLEVKLARMSFFASIINMMALSFIIIISKLFF